MNADVTIAGAGIIGLALGLELRLRGMSVVVLERGQAMRGATWAAGGMLAAEDPQNPPAMMELARLSARLYPEWLKRIEGLSGVRVPMRTRWTLQWVGPEVREAIATAEEICELAPGFRAEGLQFRLIEEGSVDPRDLCAALPGAFEAAGGILVEGCEAGSVTCLGDELRIRIGAADFAAKRFVNCCGAWAGAVTCNSDNKQQSLPVEPVKGQMAELQCAPERLKCVVRGPGIYLIPRGDGRVAVGATLERAGFDEHVEAGAVRGLVNAARRLMPELSLPVLQSWAGLRPGTPDGLPVMGPSLAGCEGDAAPRCWYATGHYRDGILLAPATARVMAQAIAGRQSDVALEAFSVSRFAGLTASR